MKLFTFILILFPAVMMAQDTTLAKEDDRKSRKQTPMPDTAMVNDLLSTAGIYLGCPYQYASNVPERGFDCSGFVYFLYQQHNITPPRSSGEYNDVEPRIDMDRAVPGDIVVFKGRKGKTPGHVGIITCIDGNDVSFIHSSTSRGVIISKISEPYYEKRFLFIVRLPGKPAE